MHLTLCSIIVSRSRNGAAEVHAPEDQEQEKIQNMLCEICKKNEATIHIQEIVGGKKKSIHLCSSCAAEKQQHDGLDFGAFNLAGLICKLTNGAMPDLPFENNAPADSGNSGEEKSSGKEVLRCPDCQWDQNLLQQTGRLGCSECYRVFAPMLDGVLKNMHHGLSHVGKHPAGQGGALAALHSELTALQKSLQHAVEQEDYETAAVLRDRINELKKQCTAAENAEKGLRDGNG